MSPSSDKGKAPISDDDDDCQSPTELLPQTCGICFSKQGKTVRGLVDSCDHYFCFVCIVEWSKVESRCPLCRGRFSNIRRMRKDGSFIGDSSVRVPIRDQIYDPFGEPNDPYGQVKCSVCDSATEESLLLLCDLCDSPWHTYCVGLGVTVPEGDWYCRDCTLLRSEQCEGETNDACILTSSKTADTPSSNPDPVSIFDIVRDTMEPARDPGIERLLKLTNPSAKLDPSSIIASDRANTSKASGKTNLRSSVDGTELKTGSNLKSPADDATDSGARTLRNCRNAQRYISFLRENWDAIRNGTLSFDQALSQSQSSGKTSDESHSLYNSSTLHSTDRATSRDVDKAWKMINIAKQQVSKSKTAHKSGLNKTRDQKAKNVPSNRVMSGVSNMNSPKLGLPKPSYMPGGMSSQRSGQHQFTTSVQTKAASTSSFKSPNMHSSRLSLSGKIQTLAKTDIYDKRTASSSNTVQKSNNFCDGSVSGSKSITKELPICPGKQGANVNALVQADTYHGTTHLPIERDLAENSSALGKRKASLCSTPACEDLKVAGNASGIKMQGGEISKRLNIGVKIGSEVSKNDDDAKGEIQSLVKLNLSLLSKSKKIGTDVFKEIARASTHTILAACGFEHRKIVHSYPKSVCHHGDRIQQHNRSTLMPSACKDCFYLFVKDVVSSIMSEKLNNAPVVG